MLSRLGRKGRGPRMRPGKAGPPSGAPGFFVPRRAGAACRRAARAVPSPGMRRVTEARIRRLPVFRSVGLQVCRSSGLPASWGARRSAGAGRRLNPPETCPGIGASFGRGVETAEIATLHPAVPGRKCPLTERCHVVGAATGRIVRHSRPSLPRAEPPRWRLRPIQGGFSRGREAVLILGGGVSPLALSLRGTWVCLTRACRSGEGFPPGGVDGRRKRAALNGADRKRRGFPGRPFPARQRPFALPRHPARTGAWSGRQR